LKRRTTKLVESVKGLHYNERLKVLCLIRLHKRRDKSDLIETFNIMNRNYSMDRDLFFATDDGGRRRHYSKLFKDGVDRILENLF